MGWLSSLMSGSVMPTPTPVPVGTVPGDVGSAPPSDYRGASLATRLRGWVPRFKGINRVVSDNQRTLAGRTREQVRNNPYAKRAAGLLNAHMIGGGIVPRSLCGDAALTEDIQKVWDNWIKDCDAFGDLDFYALQSLAVAEMIAGGECFARMRVRYLSDGFEVPLQIQLLPSEMVPLNWAQPNPDAPSNPVSQGIERDANIGARVNYWMYYNNPYDITGLYTNPDYMPHAVSADQVCHLYQLLQPGQERGLPWLSTALPALKQVNDYLDSELLRKQLAAALAGFIKRSRPSDMTNNDLAQLGKVQQAPEDVMPTVTLEPGTIQYLGDDEEITFSQPADVGQNFDPFLAWQFRGIASAAEVLYEELTGDWRNMNDRTFRAEFNTFKRRIRQFQFGLVCTQFNKPIYEKFLDLAVAAGALKIPAGMSDADFKAVQWVPQRWEYINPVQEAEALGLELSMKLTSRSAVIRSRGDDPAMVDQQIKDDQEREATLGIQDINNGIPKASVNVPLGEPGSSPDADATTTQGS